MELAEGRREGLSLLARGRVTELEDKPLTFIVVSQRAVCFSSSWSVETTDSLLKLRARKEWAAAMRAHRARDSKHLIHDVALQVITNSLMMLRDFQW